MLLSVLQRGRLTQRPTTPSSDLFRYSCPFGFLGLGFLLRFSRVNRSFPEFGGVAGARTVIWAFLSVFLVAAILISRLVPRLRPE